MHGKNTQIKKKFLISGAYKDFMSCCKTERECVSQMIKMAEKAGYRNLEEITSQGIALKPGDKVYACLLYTSDAADEL